jgi:hypothetical protein
MKKAVCIILSGIGIICLMLTIAYVLSLGLFVFSDSPWVGDIAYLPKWVIPLSLLTFFAKKVSNEKIGRKYYYGRAHLN